MKARALQRVEFELLLARRPVVRSAHFALHHVAAALLASPQSQIAMQRTRLSTETAQNPDKTVDNLMSSALVGCMMPKRHAKRAVTRNLLRRQAQTAVHLCQPALSPGLWLVRLQKPWPREAWPSAASTLLRQQAGAELRQLLHDGAKRVLGARP